MSMLSAGWPRCPNHFTWMQPTLKPRRWRCNFPMIGGPDFDGRGSTCPETEGYRWWRYLDRTVFSLLEVSVQEGYFYCPVCEAFFGGKEQTFFRVDLPGVYCRKCDKFLCSPQCVAQHPCAAQEPATRS